MLGKDLRPRVVPNLEIDLESAKGSMCLSRLDELIPREATEDQRCEDQEHDDSPHYRVSPPVTT